jgi:formiminotetrahydrofolate cyclodeaminase
MENSLWDKTLIKFLENTASDAPTPGGGSVTMVSAALGLGLVIMAVEISLNHQQATVEELAAMTDLLNTARGQMRSLTLHADEDIVAFNRYMDSLALPKKTPEQKIQRKQAMEMGILAATNVPLAAARDTLAAIDTGTIAVRLVHKRVISDVGAGAAILGGAIAGVLLNVDINLTHLSDPELKQRFAVEREQLAQTAQEKVEIILTQVNQRLCKK